MPHNLIYDELVTALGNAIEAYESDGLPDDDMVVEWRELLTRAKEEL